MDGTGNHVTGAVAVFHDHGQFHHVGFLQFHGIHKRYDVAVVAGRSCQFQYEAGGEVAKHLHPQVSLEVMTFVNYHHRMQKGKHLNKGRWSHSVYSGSIDLIAIFQEIAVLPVGQWLALLVACVLLDLDVLYKRGRTEHEDGQVVTHLM